MSKTIPNYVKKAVENCVQHIHFESGKVETTKLQNKLITEYGILFFDIPLLENLIKEELNNGKVQTTC